MLVLCAYNNFQICVQLSAQGVLWKHASNSILNQTLWVLFHHLFCKQGTLTTWISCVADVLLHLHFLSRQFDFFCIDNNYVITTIDVRSEIWLVLATDNFCNFRGQTT